MPRVSFSQEFRSADTERFPKLKLAVAEKARLWMPEAGDKPGMGPWMEWYHRIEAPEIKDGEPVMEVKETRRGPVETWKMDWIGNVFCIGETGTIEKPGPLMLHGIDPGNCPACESAANKTGVPAPQQRFAINTIKYKVKGRGPKPYDLASPISAEVLIWAYTSRMHGMLHELESEHGELRGHDVKIEMEDSPGADTYQKMKQVAVIVQPAHADPKVREYVTDLWQRHPENRATDDQLRDACLGRDVPRLVMMDMVRRAEKQYSQAEQAGSGGGDAAAADSGFNGDLSSGVDALLDTAPVSGPSGDWDEPADPSGDAPVVPADPWLGETNAAMQAIDAENAAQAGGGLDEFLPADPTDKDIDRLPQGADDPFGDGTSTAGGATTTVTSAPAAERTSPTGPKSAASAASSSEEEDLSEPVSETTQAGRGTRRAKAKAAEQPSLDAPEPQPAAAGSGAVIDFDDLFS